MENDIIKFVDGYGSIILEDKRKAAKVKPKREPTTGKT